MKNIGTKPITTKRLYLRKFNSEDAQAMFDNWCSDPKVVTYLTWPIHQAIEDTKTILNVWLQAYTEPHTYRWIITNKETGEAMGSIDCVAFNEEHELCDMGYCIGSKYFNQGIMSEALQAVVKYLFEEVGIHRITARHDSDNIASGRVMEKAGMQKEGILRQSFKNRQGCFADMVHYAILKEDYFQGKNS